MPEDFSIKQVAEDAVNGATAAATFSEQYNTIMSRNGAERNGTANAQTPQEVTMPSFTDVPERGAKSGSSTSDKPTNVPEESAVGKPTTVDKTICAIGEAAYLGWTYEAMKTRNPIAVAIPAALTVGYSYICRNEFKDMGSSIKNFVTGSDSKK